VKYINLKYLVVLFFVISFFLAFLFRVDLSKDISSFSIILSRILNIDIIFLFILSTWGWRYKIFKGWLINYPDLNGTWIGNIESDWVNPETDRKLEPIITMLTIKQNLLSISCKMRTAEMSSNSFAEGFIIDNEKQINQLYYSYISSPYKSVEHRSANHCGTVVLDIINLPFRTLSGKYWTERKTSGQITLDFHSKDLLEDIPPEMHDHPMST